MEVRQQPQRSNACTVLLVAFCLGGCAKEAAQSIPALIEQLDQGFKQSSLREPSPLLFSAKQRQDLWECPPEHQALLQAPTLFHLSESWPKGPLLSDTWAPLDTRTLAPGDAFAECRTKETVRLHKVALRFGPSSDTRTLHARVLEHEGKVYLLGL